MSRSEDSAHPSPGLLIQLSSRCQRLSRSAWWTTCAHWRWCPGTPSWKTVVVSRQVEYSSWSSVNETHIVPGREKSSDGGVYHAPPSLTGATLQAMVRIGSAMSK